MNRILVTLITLAACLCASARQPHAGYRGFFEWSNDLRQEEFWPGFSGRSTLFYTGFSTSHGYQCTPWVFVGAGLSLEYCPANESHILAPFVQGRTDLKFGNFTPFGDVRVGYNLSDGGGIYFSPSVGYRFNWGRKVGINLGVGLTLQGYAIDHYEVVILPDDYVWLTYTGRKHGAHALFSFRIGLDF
ncbi:MAG: hypothetical protein K2M19_09380 [Muribaculaceae bacterium]|nr:hypothetical protein [Muribaculaceae bacterium]